MSKKVLAVFVLSTLLLCSCDVGREPVTIDKKSVTVTTPADESSLLDIDEDLSEESSEEEEPEEDSSKADSDKDSSLEDEASSGNTDDDSSDYSETWTTTTVRTWTTTVRTTAKKTTAKKTTARKTTPKKTTTKKTTASSKPNSGLKPAKPIVTPNPNRPDVTDSAVVDDSQSTDVNLPNTDSNTEE